MRKITINNKSYNAKPMTFNTICDLEDLGITLEDFEKKQMSFIRAYIVLCMGSNATAAGEEIENHVMNGGDLKEIAETIKLEIEESDFFRSLKEKAETNVAESKSEEAETKK